MEWSNTETNMDSQYTENEPIRINVLKTTVYKKVKTETPTYTQPSNKNPTWVHENT